MKHILMLVLALLGFALFTGSVTLGSSDLAGPGMIRITSRDINVKLVNRGSPSRGMGDVLVIRQLLFNKGITKKAIGHSDLSARTRAQLAANGTYSSRGARSSSRARCATAGSSSSPWSEAPTSTPRPRLDDRNPARPGAAARAPVFRLIVSQGSQRESGRLGMRQGPGRSRSSCPRRDGRLRGYARARDRLRRRPADLAICAAGDERPRPRPDEEPIAIARSATPPELADRVWFEVGEAEDLSRTAVFDVAFLSWSL